MSPMITFHCLSLEKCQVDTEKILFLIFFYQVSTGKFSREREMGNFGTGPFLVQTAIIPIALWDQKLFTHFLMVPKIFRYGTIII